MVQLVRPHRRRTLRRAYLSRCQAVRLDGFSLFAERILDVSPDGALLACDGPVDPGEEVLISFRAPRGGPWVDAVGEVCRVFGDDVGYCAGVRFEGLQTGVRYELGRRLRFIPPPVPRRRPTIDYARTVRRIAALG